MHPLVRIIPPFLVRTFARPYVAGDSLEAALDVVTELRRARGLLSSLDLLAEDIEDAATARRNLETYLVMVDAVADETRLAARDRPTLSLKLSSYTTAPLDHGGDGDGSRAALFAIAERAAARGVGLTIDMESHPWTDFTLTNLRDLHAAGLTGVGIVLQTRLQRTQQDVSELPTGCRVRLVIGIYDEPAAIAVTDKQVMKERLLTCAATLLERGHYVEMATHDEAILRRFVDEVVPRAGVGPEGFEIQMLYGVPRERLIGELLAAGITVRLYVPFALGWPMAIAYLRRRLDEYPRMMFLVAKNLFAGD